MLGIFDHRTSSFFSSHADWERWAASSSPSMSLFESAPVDASVSDALELTPPTAPGEERKEAKDDVSEDSPASERRALACPGDASGADHEGQVLKEEGQLLRPALAPPGAENGQKTAQGSSGTSRAQKRKISCMQPSPLEEEHPPFADPSGEKRKRGRPSLEPGKEASVTRRSPRKKLPEVPPVLPAHLSQEQDAAEVQLEEQERGGSSLLVESRVKAYIKQSAEGLRMKKDALAALDLRARRLLDLTADKVLKQGRKVLNGTDF